MKKAMFAFVAILAVAFMASSAFAAASLSAGNSTVAAEAIDSAAGSIFTPGVTNAFQSGGLLGVGTQIKVSLTNATFTAADQITLCRGTTIVGGPAVVPAAPGNNSVTITTTQAISAADILTLTHAANCLAPAPLDDVRLKAGLAAGSTATMSFDNAVNAGDPLIAATATMVTAKQQFAATLAPVTTKLNFTTNMKTFIADAPVPANPPHTPDNLHSQAALTITSDESIAMKVATLPGAGPCQRTLAAAADATATIVLTGDLTGIASVDAVDEIAPLTVGTHPVVAADVTAASATLTLDGLAIRLCRTNDTPVVPLALQLTSANVDTIIAGTRSASLSLKGAGGVGNTFANTNARTLVAATPSHIIQLDAASAIIPFLSTNPTVKTNCVISNTSSTLTGTVTFTVTAKDGGGVLPGTFTLGTIGPKTTVNLIFDTNNATLGANPPVVLGLGANVRFSGNIAVSAPPSGLAFNCLQTDPVAGPKRLVPVLQANSTNMPIF